MFLYFPCGLLRLIPISFSDTFVSMKSCQRKNSIACQLCGQGECSFVTAYKDRISFPFLAEELNNTRTLPQNFF